jgi:hypothetical protein
MQKTNKNLRDTEQRQSNVANPTEEQNTKEDISNNNTKTDRPPNPY